MTIRLPVGLGGKDEEPLTGLFNQARDLFRDAGMPTAEVTFADGMLVWDASLGTFFVKGAGSGLQLTFQPPSVQARAADRLNDLWVVCDRTKTEAAVNGAHTTRSLRTFLRNRGVSIDGDPDPSTG